MHGLGESALVENGVAELVEFRPRLGLDDRAPEFDQARRPPRRLEAGQPFAHQHRDGVLQRRLVAIARLGEGTAMVAVVEHRGEVRGDALHAPCADRLDARLLDRVEQRARHRIDRRKATVDRVVVAGQAQRHRIGEAAQNRRLARIGLARRLGQACSHALGAADQGGLVGGEGDLQLGMARHRARARGERALERLVGRLRLAGGLAIAGLDVDGRHWRAALSSTRRSTRFPAVPGRSSADRTRRPTCARVRRTC